ncbi:hypothetical protein FE257_006953 [Aspergillus nanangensis]|uniref:Cytochrome P450 n=1 Tax=Aspergillus nanangensis TaxID=2582783 RepID=A0AAD4CQB5_ASPNN|nr:hypothetical protein FE257_006953 [Aspergillus nanangensis]
MVGFETVSTHVLQILGKLRMASILFQVIISLLALCLAYSVFTRKKAPAPLPPGPPQKPIIGNLGDLPPPGVQDWQHWLKHKELYGPISSVTVFGQTLVILNKARLAVELLEKRSAIHSSRLRTPFAYMSGWNHVLGTLAYSEDFRTTRKNLHRQIGSGATVSRFDKIQEAEVGRFLLRLFHRPDELIHHIRKQAGALILRVGYGYTIEPHERDPLVDLADKAMGDFGVAVAPGAWVVDYIPILRHLPSWFPGAGFKQIAEGFKKTVVTLSDQPYQWVKQRVAQNDFEPSLLSGLLETSNFVPGSEEERVTKWSAASLYAGGSDTTVSSIATFFLAMTLYPEAQRKAQAEIDRVVGHDRLPGFKDRPNLSYNNALIKEILRWHPVSPIALPHLSMEDDMCDGYFIPKGSSVLPNIWAFTHDPDVYPDPMQFKPERFIESDSHIPEYDPYMLAFGFGRRTCPGRVLADASVYLNVTQSLAVFNISKSIEDVAGMGNSFER